MIDGGAADGLREKHKLNNQAGPQKKNTHYAETLKKSMEKVRGGGILKSGASREDRNIGTE